MKFALVRRKCAGIGPPSDASPGCVSTIDGDEGVLVATGDGGTWMTEIAVDSGGNAADLLTVGTHLA